MTDYKSPPLPEILYSGILKMPEQLFIYDSKFN